MHSFLSVNSPVLDYLIRRMNPSEDNEFSFTSFTPTTDFTKVSSTKPTSEPIDVVSVDAIVLNIYLKLPYSELEGFVDEYLRPKGRSHGVSTLHRYALESTREPIDTSNQSVRTTYRPNLFTRKNDGFFRPVELQLPAHSPRAQLSTR